MSDQVPPVAWPASVTVVETGWGCLAQVPALRTAGFSVRRLVGTDVERTRKRATHCGISHSTVELSEALSDPEVRAVVVATPPTTHVEDGLANTLVHAPIRESLATGTPRQVDNNALRTR